MKLSSAKKLLAFLLSAMMVASMSSVAFAEAAPAEEIAAGESDGASQEGESQGEESDSEGESGSGDSAGESEEPEEGIVITESLTFEDGVTLEEGSLYIAEPGYCVIMTVNGQVTAQAPGTYEGKVIFEVIPKTSSSDNTGSTYNTKSLITKNADSVVIAASAVNGEITDEGISGADITADSPHISIVTVTGGEYSISDSRLHTLQTGNHASGGDDFSGDGCAIAATGASTVRINGVDAQGDGVTRTILFGGLSDRYNYPTVYVSNSHFTSTGDSEAEDGAVWVLGLHGVVRTCQFCDYYDIYYYNTVIRSFGWACMSVDGTEYPFGEDLAELKAAYVDGQGYVNADGEIMELNEFAVAATGLTDDYLAALASVDSKEALEQLPQTNDNSLYYFSGKNTLVNSQLEIMDMDQGRTGYSSFTIGANINVYSNCIVKADYGNVEENEYASSAYVNGTVVNARKNIVMSHANAGGITFVADSELNAGEIAFLYKGAGDGYKAETSDSEEGDSGSSSSLITSPTGSYLYVRNTLINAPVLVAAFDTDDPGLIAADNVLFDDSIAGKDENFDVTSTNFWGPANPMSWPEESIYNYNAAVTVYFEDCSGETSLQGDIFNCHQYASKNLILTLDNSELTGVISSGYAQHKVDGVDRTIPFGGENVIGEDGKTYGYREYFGNIDCTPSETVNNGIILTLKNGAVWNVTATSYISGLSVDDSSVVNGVITDLGNGLYQVDPLN